MKKRWGIALAALVLVAVLAFAVAPKHNGTILENDPAEETNPDEIIIPDDSVPLSGDIPVPDDPYEGLNETQIAYVDEVLRLVNEAREENGLMPLRLDPHLRKAAQVRATECVTAFSHTRPNGSRYKTAIEEAGVSASYTGENVATGYKTPDQVVRGWMASEGHKANILNEHFTRIGIGLAENTGNRYRGYAWAQLFAND